MRVTAIVPAAGLGSRLQRGIPKPFVSVGGVPILLRTLRALDATGAVESFIVVVPPGEERRTGDLLQAMSSSVHVIPGGRERQESVFLGIQRAAPGVDLFLIHDGVRPFVSPDTVREAVTAAATWGAAVVAVPVVDTVKEVGEDGVVTRTLDRQTLWLAQTPQVFRAALIRRAHEDAHRAGIHGTDDAALVERLGEKVVVIPGSPRNLKITTEDDLSLAEALCRGEEG